MDTSGYQNAIHTKHISEFHGLEYPDVITKYNFRLLLEEEFESIAEIKRPQHIPSTHFYDAIGRDQPPAEYVGFKPQKDEQANQKHYAARMAAWKHHTGCTNGETSKYNIHTTVEGIRQIFWKPAQTKAAKEGKHGPAPLFGGEWLFMFMAMSHHDNGHLSRDRMYDYVSKAHGGIQKAFVAKFVGCCCSKATNWAKWSQDAIAQEPDYNNYNNLGYPNMYYQLGSCEYVDSNRQLAEQLMQFNEGFQIDTSGPPMTPPQEHSVQASVQHITNESVTIRMEDTVMPLTPPLEQAASAPVRQTTAGCTFPRQSLPESGDNANVPMPPPPEQAAPGPLFRKIGGLTFPLQSLPQLGVQSSVIHQELNIDPRLLNTNVEGIADVANNVNMFVINAPWKKVGDYSQDKANAARFKNYSKAGMFV